MSLILLLEPILYEVKALRIICVVVFWLIGIVPALGQIGFPYCESFQTAGTQATTISGGNAQLSPGVLRLTSNLQNQRGHVYLDISFPSTYGLKAEFEYFSYGGTGWGPGINPGDGFTVFLFDADTPVFNSGGFGGSLGYGPRDQEPGLSNGYLGIGFDEYGGFGTTNGGLNGGFPNQVSTQLVPNSIVVRGPGNLFLGYPFVMGKKTMEEGPDGLSPADQFPISSGGLGTTRVTDRNKPGYRKVLLELQPNSNGLGFFLKLKMEVTTETDKPRMVSIFERPYFFSAPKNLKIGFAASTGGSTNFHEIRNLIVQVAADDALKDPQGIDFSEIATCAGQENQFFITDEEVVLPNENSAIRCLQFYKSPEDIEEESGDLCTQARCLEQNRVLIVPQGVFQANDQAGGFTFFPNEEFIDEEVTVYYTITDSYGKTSKGNSIKLKIQESPEPISLLVSGSSELVSQIDICEGELVSFEGIGNEEYDRFEWFKDGVMVPGENQDTFTTGEPGEYEILGYNRKNCPAISNKVTVRLPDFPPLEIDSPVVECQIGQLVDMTSQINGYDPVTYDYQLSGMGTLLTNEEMKAVSLSGLYELRVKFKELDCYSEAVEVEVFIQEEELTIDFDFGVQGSGIKDEAGGGVFPSDVIEFTDMSDPRAVKWEWDFGDETGSQDKNPTHVYGKKGDFISTLIITDEYGCQQSISKTVSVTRSYRLMIPTGFTPGKVEDGTFLPKQKGLVKFELLIFNTWGELIFRTEDLNTTGWDGTLNGKLLDAGIYVYRVNGEATDGEIVEESGKFRLIR